MLQIEVELSEDLVDSCIPGNVVTVSGVVKSINSEIHGGRYGKRAQSNSLYILYLSANAVENSAKVYGHRCLRMGAECTLPDFVVCAC